MTLVPGSSPGDVYEAVITLARSIAGLSDLESLLSGVGESVRGVVGFNYIGLSLHDPGGDRMRGYVWREAGSAVEVHATPVDQEPAGWVWLNQQPLVIRCVEDESRWPEFRDRARAIGIRAVTVVPLTAGDDRLGAFGFGCATPYEPGPAELAFLERVANEFAVAVESFIAKQETARERDRLRTLFDITNALVSQLDRDELFSAISEQLSNIIRHDYALLTLCTQTGGLDVFALHCTRPQFLHLLKGPIESEGMPSSEVLATGKAVVVRDADIDRFPNPRFARYVELGIKSACLVPLTARDRTIGTLDLGRMTDDPWTPDDVEFLVEVAKQVSLAVQNALAYRELEELKDRLATEKLNLEDDIRLDQNIGHMVGRRRRFSRS